MTYDLFTVCPDRSTWLKVGVAKRAGGEEKKREKDPLTSLHAPSAYLASSDATEAGEETRRGWSAYKSAGAHSRDLDERRLSCGVRRMVACAAPITAHSSVSTVGGGERRAPVASPEVSRTALFKAGSMTATPAAIEQLKQQLTTAIENKDAEKSTLAIEELERLNLTREVMEGTRIGLYVNQARKEISEIWPPLGKRCRALIKAWQKLVDATTTSSSASTSRNGTPSLVSPAVGRRLTPHTPANAKRITPGLANERASNLSPGANGSYAPKGGNMLSPGLGMHKSHSVGFDLKDENGGVRNGKRKQDEPVPGTAPSSIKRAKTTASGLSAAAGATTSPAPPCASSLIENRRAAVMSTSDLVAQLTSNLPQHLGFEDAAKAHEEKVKREQEDQQLAAAIAGNGEPAPSPYTTGKRKYERKKPLTGTPSTPGYGAAASSSSTTTVRIVTPPPEEEGGARKGGLVLKLSLSRTTLVETTPAPAQPAATPATALDRKEEKERRKREKREAAALHASKSAPALALLDESRASTSSPSAAAAPSTSAAARWLQQQQQPTSSSSAASSIDGGDKKKEKIDWFSMVPSIEELKKRVEKDKERRKVIEGMTDAEKAYTLHVGDRVVLALPYIEIEDKPDFLKFNYPDPGRFYAEENFIGGLMERPVHAPPPAAAAASGGSTPATAAAGQK